MTWTEFFVWCIAAMLLAFAYLCYVWIHEPKFRKEAGVKLHGDPSDEEEVSFATVKDYDDPKEHPDQWSEKIVLPARGRRPEMVIIIRNSTLDQEDGEETTHSYPSGWYFFSTVDQLPS